MKVLGEFAQRPGAPIEKSLSISACVAILLAIVLVDSKHHLFASNELTQAMRQHVWNTYYSFLYD
jgi:hypothetical protein